MFYYLMFGPELGLAIFFIIGVFSSVHCLGMCGPLITLYSDRGGFSEDKTQWRDIRQHLFFNLGRTISYAFIGVLIGGIGMVVFDVAAVASIVDLVRGVSGLLIGVFIIITGITYIRSGTTLNIPSINMSVPFLEKWFSRVRSFLTSHIDNWVNGPRIVGLGMIHGILPCPVIYPAYMYAFVQGSPIFGGLSLAALGLGTIPTLFSYGVILESVNTQIRMKLHRGLGVSFILLGYIPLSMGLVALGFQVPHLDIPIYQPLAG